LIKFSIKAPEEYRYEGKRLMALVWGIVIAADVITLLYFMAGQKNIERYVTNDFNAQIIREFEQVKQNADLSVVLFGNSRMRHAITFGFDPKEIVRLPDGRKMAVIHFAPDAARFDLYSDVTYRVLKSEPDLIIVQDSVISNARNTVPNMVGWSKTVSAFLERMVTDIDDYKLWYDDRMYVATPDECMKEFTRWGLDRQLAFNADRDRHELSEENLGYRQARDFINWALAENIKVMIVSVGSNTQMLDRFDVPSHKTDFYGLGFYPSKKQLLPENHERVRWLEGMPPLESSFYCDYVHYNKKGREVYTSWLLKRISEIY
jgi:hypothetical protein